MAKQENNPKLILSTPVRVALLLCITFVCFFLMSLLSGVTTHWGESITTPKIRILTIIQDVLVFIIPALATAMMVTRIPASLLCINKNTNISTVLLAVLTMIASIPAMNMIITWNAGIHLPESMENIEIWLRASENSASQSISLILGKDSIGDLIMSIMIVGVAAGFSEELYFRGALQRLLSTGGISRHGAIWIAAIIFSLFHFQFFGFIPRMLLGAFFGYLLVWTGCIWLPITAHILNNTIYIVNNWISMRQGLSEVSPGNEMPDSPQSVLLIAISVALTVVGLYLTRKSTRKSAAI